MSKSVPNYTCPLGHTYAADEFHMYVDMNVTELENSVTFFCPHGQYGHGFDLRRAVAFGMISPEQAADICLRAQVLREKKRG